MSQFKWFSDKTKDVFSSFLTDRALDYFYTISHSAKKYEDKETILNVFRETACPFRTEEVIRSRKQMIGEPTYAYIMSKSRLIRT